MPDVEDALEHLAAMRAILDRMEARLNEILVLIDHVESLVRQGAIARIELAPEVGQGSPGQEA